MPFRATSGSCRALIFDAMASGGLGSLEKKLARLGVPAPHMPAPVHPTSSCPIPDPSPLPLPTLDQAVQDLVQEALRRSSGNQAAAARMLGISRQALNKRIIRMQRPE
jgi:transcriptional regulator with GAF, ATPase, and Fis domain